MSDPSSQLVSTITKKSLITNDIITENRCLYYLSGCYERLSRQRVNYSYKFLLINSEKKNLYLESF